MTTAELMKSINQNMKDQACLFAEWLQINGYIYYRESKIWVNRFTGSTTTEKLYDEFLKIQKGN